MTTKISVEDRQAIYDNLRMYAWCLDRADGAGVAGCFTPDGWVQGGTGQRFIGPVRVAEFVKNASSQPGFFGRQHHIQPLFFEDTAEGYTLTSYWQVVTWHAGEQPGVILMGYYVDKCVKVGGEWRFSEKQINRWDSTTTPPLAQ